MLAGGDKRRESKIPQPVALIEVIHPAAVGVVVISVVFYADAVIRVGDSTFIVPEPRMWSMIS